MGRASLWQRPARASALETRDADAELPERAGARLADVGAALKSCSDRGVAESAGLVENVDVKRLRHTPSFLPIASVFVLRSEKAVAHLTSHPEIADPRAADGGEPETVRGEAGDACNLHVEHVRLHVPASRQSGFR